MSDSKSGNNDPSMDDILASIRKIISDDEARAQVGGGAAPTPAAEQDGPSANVTQIPLSPEARLAAMAKREDVLLLTDLVEEPKTSPHATRPAPAPVAPIVTPVPTPSEPAPAPPRIDPVSVAAMPQPNEPTSSVDQSLVGASVAGAASSAFDRLSQAVQESVPAPSAADPGPTMASGRTLEDVVKDMLKPMLKEWLDRNLPPMVERFVEREIVRLTRR
jgi:cell pole-organizing protein PopZ